jgi:hypothetical protein
LAGTSVKRAKEEDMSDEEIREEEPEVEGHGRAPGGRDTADAAEGVRPAHDDDSDDVEAHAFKPGVKDAKQQQHIE